MTSTQAYGFEELHLPSDRSFGVTVSALFALVASMPLLDGRVANKWAFALAILFGVIAILKPPVLHRANVVWARFGVLLQQIINPVILAILFFVILVPFGTVVRMFRKDLLQLNFNPRADSYWIKPEKYEKSPQSMINRF